MTHTTRAACALALLLAGCSKEPAPKPLNSQSHGELEKTVKDLDQTVDNVHVGALTEVVVHVGTLMEIVRGNERTIAALRKRVAELEKRLEVATATRHGWTDYDITDGDWVNVPSERHPVKRFHHEGGAWCNVWADDKGLHWEACK